MRNIFLEKSYIQRDEETSARHFSKLSIYLDQKSEILYNLGLLYV